MAACNLQITAKLRDATNNWERGFTATQFAMTGDSVHFEVRSVGTAEEELTINADITGGADPHYCVIYNRGPTNFVQVGISTGAYFAKFRAGEFGVFPLDAGVTSLFLKAATAACVVEVCITEG